MESASDNSTTWLWVVILVVIVIAIIAAFALISSRESAQSAEASARYWCGLQYKVYSTEWSNCIADQTR